MRSKSTLIELPASPSSSLATGLVVVPDLSRLPLAQLQAMQHAGLEILDCYRVLKKARMNIVGEVLPPVRWGNRYRPGVRDGRPPRPAPTLPAGA